MWMSGISMKIIAPGVGIALQMHHGDDEQVLVSKMIDDGVGKSVGEATMCVPGKFCPR